MSPISAQTLSYNLLAPLTLALLLQAQAFTAPDNVQSMADWLQQAEGTLHQHIAVQDLPIYGRSIIALEDIPAHQVLAKIPVTKILHQYSIQVGRLAQMLLCMNIVPSQTDVTALHLAFERKAGDSAWKPYLDALPETYDLLISLDDDKLEEFQGLPIVDVSRIRKNRARKAFNETITSIEELMEGDSLTRRTKTCSVSFADLEHRVSIIRELTYEDFMWGLCTLWSRNFKVKLKNEEGKSFEESALVPFADLFNSGDRASDVNVLCYTNTIGDGFICRNSKNVTKGDQLFAQYSEHEMDNNRLMMLYGYAALRNPVQLIWLKLPQIYSEDSVTMAKQLEYIVSEVNLRILEVDINNWRSTLLRYFHILSRETNDEPYNMMLEYLTEQLNSFPTTEEEDRSKLSTTDDNAILRYRLITKRQLIVLIGDCTPYANDALDAGVPSESSGSQSSLSKDEL